MPSYRAVVCLCFGFLSFFLLWPWPDFFSPTPPPTLPPYHHTEVALGRVYQTPTDMPALLAPPPGHDSVHAVASTSDSQSAFAADEHVVYDVTQQRVKYLIELQTTPPMASTLPATLASSTTLPTDRTAARTSFRRRESPLSSAAQPLPAPLSLPKRVPTLDTAAPALVAATPTVALPPCVPKPVGRPLGSRATHTRTAGDGAAAWCEPLTQNTALVLCAEGSLATAVDALRWDYDEKHVGIWPPHVTLLYPFVQPDDIAAAVAALEAVGSTLAPLSTTLGRVGTFDQGRRGYLHYLEPQPASAVATLHAAACTALRGLFARRAPPETPHMTIARGQPVSLEAMLQERWTPRAFCADAFVVLKRDGPGWPMQEVARVSFGSAATAHRLPAPEVPADWLVVGGDGGDGDGEGKGKDTAHTLSHTPAAADSLFVLGSSLEKKLWDTAFFLVIYLGAPCLWSLFIVERQTDR